MTQLRLTYLLTVIFLCCSVKSQAQVPNLVEVSSELGITDVKDIADLYGNGAAAADFDSDGDIDFYLTTDGRMPDRLYRNDGTGHFEDVAIELGLLNIRANRAALWWDYNGDHRLDLVVAGENCINRSCDNPVHLALYRQLENGRFQEVSRPAGLIIDSAFNMVPYFAVGGLAAGDFNRDEYLDLIVTVWGGGIKYFENNTDGTFSDKTAAAGLISDGKTPWQPMVYDFNRDGLPDIYCNIDFTANKLWINRGGVFEERAKQYGLDHAFNEMGMSITDFDNDADLDIYITNITRLHEGQEQYNVLFEQTTKNGSITFTETARGLGISQSGWDWGTTFFDINNDGRQDLATTNGWINISWPADQSKLWMNTKAGFIDISQRCSFNDKLSATTLLAFDKDNDGDQDLLQTLKDNDNAKKPVLIYENKLEELSYPGNFVRIKPRMPGNNHFAIGSEVTLIAEQLTSSRLISAGNSFYGQEPAEAFFGLGALDSVREVLVRWPDATVTIYQNIAINQVNTLNHDFLEAPESLAAILQEDQIELYWTDYSDNEEGFVLHRSEDSTFSNYKVIELARDATIYFDSALQPNTRYYYRVRAYRGTACSDNSNIVSVNSMSAAVWSEEEQSIIFPNPIIDRFIHVKSSSSYTGPVEFRFLDFSGRELWSASARKTDYRADYTYEVAVPGGIYFLWVKMGNKEEWHQLLVMR